MADPKLRPTGMEQGDLCQLLYETVVALITTACTTANFTITVYDKARLNSVGPAAQTMPLYIKPTGIDQGYLADFGA